MKKLTAVLFGLSLLSLGASQIILYKATSDLVEISKSLHERTLRLEKDVAKLNIVVAPDVWLERGAPGSKEKDN